MNYYIANVTTLTLFGRHCSCREIRAWCIYQRIFRRR